MKTMHRQMLWREMLRIRRIEEAIATRYREQEMRCPVHLSIGQEAVAVGVCSALSREDIVFSNHRSHAHYLAKGGCLQGLVAELYGKSGGCSGGRGGSMHLIDRGVGFWGATPIVAGTVPIATGVAMAQKLSGNDRVVAVFFGDGCVEEGVVHEAMNVSSLHKLPILFVCENNGYSVYTGLGARQPERPLHEVARAHAIPAVAIDGNDVEKVHQVAVELTSKARAGHGPQFFELATYRWLEHCGPNDDDVLGYRPVGELSTWKARCPIRTLVQRMEADGEMPDSRIEEAEIDQEIAAAFDFARASTPPRFCELQEYA